MLDVEYMMAVAQVSPTTFWYVDDTWVDTYSSHDVFVYWLLQVYNTTQRPYVMSVSYGGPEYYIATSELLLFNIEMQKLSLQGVTIVVASGDDGAPNYNAVDSSSCGYYPDFPASNPYVLAVGATQGLEQSYKTEKACQVDTGGVVTSGGGFSNYYTRPSYQDAAVLGYLGRQFKLLTQSITYSPTYPLFHPFYICSATNSPTRAPAPAPTYLTYNTANRAYPDISGT